jgi:hypothetical protein
VIFPGRICHGTGIVPVFCRKTRCFLKSCVYSHEGKLKRVSAIQSSNMQPRGIVCIILLLLALLAGCTQLPGIHIISDTPDPIIGQWIGGEPPASDLHVIFYENRTFFSTSFFIGHGETTETGTWTRIERGSYSTQSDSGETTNWTYDSSEDSVFISKIPLRKYYRYKG